MILGLGVLGPACTAATPTEPPTVAEAPTVEPAATADLTVTPTASTEATEPPPPSVTDAWARTAVAHRADVGGRFDYECPSDGVPDVIWGTDVYTDDSSVCTAAVHAGAITVADGGQVTIEMRAGQDAYQASERNGIESLRYGRWPGSFVIVAP
jgi:hypothetical protein